MDYITTAIVYPNSRIHVGWAWECLGADWWARTRRAQGHEVYFVTGMDEHALKVQRRAEAQGLAPKVYCDQMAVDIEKVLRQIGISYDRFIRTSDADHERVVQALVQKAFDSGDIYEGTYEGYYCEADEAYYAEKELVNGQSPTGRPVQFIKEQNYFFRLSKYEGALKQLFKDRPDFLQPQFRQAEIVNFIESGLKDFSVSRSTFTWGVPLPFNPKHVVYVWFDALINYLTAAGLELKLKGDGAAFDARWPASVHVIGKDISRFHTIYWPAMLMCLGIELPKKVFVHGFISFKGERLSKSSGNALAPDDVVAVTGPDPFRYFLLAENQFAQDGSFSWEALMLKNNADLANDFGNLVNRSISMTRKYFPGETLRVPAARTHSGEVVASFTALTGELAKALDAFDPQAFSNACTARSRVLNLYIDRTKPWALAKDPAKADELREVLYTLLEGIRFVATGLMPVLPFTMPEVFRQLGVEAPSERNAFASLTWGKCSYQPGEPKPIFPRIELPAEAPPA